MPSYINHSAHYPVNSNAVHTVLGEQPVLFRLFRPLVSFLAVFLAFTFIAPVYAAPYETYADERPYEMLPVAIVEPENGFEADASAPLDADWPPEAPRLLMLDAADSQADSAAPPTPYLQISEQNTDIAAPAIISRPGESDGISPGSASGPGGTKLSDAVPGVDVRPGGAIARTVRVRSGERITLYDSEVRIEASGRVFLTERITVNAQGRDIKRGIEREFPLQWNRTDNKRFNLDIKVLGVTRNGAAEPYSTSGNKKMLFLRIGSRDALLAPGLHTYEIRYSIDNQFSRFEQWDEYYYNVTGNNWRLPIDEARFRLILPVDMVDAEQLANELENAPSGLRAAGSGIPPAPFYSIDFYTGRVGERGGNASVMPDGSVRTTAPLAPGQGLTVAYTWPRSVLGEAPDPEPYNPLAKAFLPDLSSLPLFLVPALIGLFYWRALRKRRHQGRMPSVIPLFSPPKGRGPGDLRYGLTGRYDFAAFGADILRLVSLGALKVSPVSPQSPRKGTRLQKLTPPRALERTWQALLQRLFPAGEPKSLVLTRQRDEHLRDVYTTTRRLAYKRNGDLYVKYKKPLFLWIFMFFCLPLLSSVLYDAESSIIFGVLFMFFGVFFFVLGFMSWRSIMGGLSSGSIIATVFGLVGIMPFWIALIVMTRMFLFQMLGELSLPDGFYSAAILGLIPPVVYAIMVPKRTPEGLELLAQAKGLIMYMKTAEKRRFEALYPPEMSVEHFENLLPYALALGVGKTWADTFAGYLERTGQEAQDFKDYSSWHSLRAFSSGVGASAASASSSGGSSSGSSGSGSGGGGSSGGGSGGGGGGGW